MGVDLSDIVEAETIDIDKLNGKTVAIDAYNVLYQFVSSIRQRDGTPLKDSRGNITSHLQGLLTRNSNLIKEGIKPIYVFDGEILELKKETVNERRKIRKKAKKEWKEALEEGDIEKAAKKARQSSRLTGKMVDEAKSFLDILGIPHVDAPHDGEAQASHMCKKGDAWATGSQDFDCLLFGSTRLVRNLGFSGRRRTRGGWKTVNVEMLTVEKTLLQLGLSREELVDVAILVGTDFNAGVKGIGAKTGLKLIKEHGRIEDIDKDIEIPNLEELRNIFLEPTVTDNYEISFGSADIKKAEEFLVEERDFSKERVVPHLKDIAKEMKTHQKNLSDWF